MSCLVWIECVEQAESDFTDVLEVNKSVFWNFLKEMSPSASRFKTSLLALYQGTTKFNLCAVKIRQIKDLKQETECRIKTKSYKEDKKTTGE